MKRYEELKTYLRKFGKVIVAFSGGIDSYFVLKAALDSIGRGNVIAVTAESPSLKESEKQQAVKLAAAIGAPHRVITTEEVSDPDYYNNPENRCYFCKNELYTKLSVLKDELACDVIIDGTNHDDLSGHRPGYAASSEHGIISPLAALGFTKNEIREISRELGLEIWNKPSSPCLSSRIPYGQRVTLEKLSMIEKAEETISLLGFSEFRVRHFEFNSDGSNIKVAKLDVAPEELEKLLSRESIETVNSKLREIGYDFVTLDLGGLRSGSLNVKFNVLKGTNGPGK